VARTATFRHHVVMPRLVRWLLLAAVAGTIFLLSAQPYIRVSNADLLDLFAHKAAHVIAYGLLAVLAAGAFEAQFGSRTLALRLTLLVVVGYGISDELHQMLVATRHPSPFDVGIDTGGALIGLLMAGWLRVPRGPQAEPQPER
jgi:hypothetical protein